jgi:hypothetical protein
VGDFVHKSVVICTFSHFEVTVAVGPEHDDAYLSWINWTINYLAIAREHIEFFFLLEQHRAARRMRAFEEVGSKIVERSLDRGRLSGTSRKVSGDKERGA